MVVPTSQADAASTKPRDLVECRFGLRGLPGRELVTAVVAGGGLTMVGFVLVNTIFEQFELSQSGVGVFVALAVIFVVAAGGTFLTHGVPAIRTAQRSFLAADEGGVRCRWRGLEIYWPYGMIGGASMKHGSFTLLDTDDVVLMQARLYGQGPSWEAGRVAAAIDERTAHASSTLPDAFESLRRGGRSLVDWLEMLDREAPRAKGAQDFRAVHRDVDDLMHAFEDLTARPEDRAAAAFALLASKSPALAERVRAGLSEASPPIVLVLCHLAPGGRDVLSQGWLDEAVTYLDEDDRKTLKTLQSARQ